MLTKIGDDPLEIPLLKLNKYNLKAWTEMSEPNILSKFINVFFSIISEIVVTY